MDGFFNPWLMTGMGILSGNRGATGNVAFSNAMAGGMQGMQQAQQMAAMQQMQQTEALRQQALMREAELERHRKALPEILSGNYTPEAKRAAALAAYPRLVVQSMLEPSKAWRPPTAAERTLYNLPEGQPAQIGPHGKLSLPAKPMVSITQAPKLPSGYQWKDPTDTSKGVERIPGTGGTESAAKNQALAAEQQRLIDAFELALTDESGELNTGRLLQARTPGSTLNNLLGRIAQNETYIKSGAAASGDESLANRASIQPSMLQIVAGSEEAILDQLRTSRRFAADYEGILKGEATQPEQPKQQEWAQDPAIQELLKSLPPGTTIIKVEE